MSEGRLIGVGVGPGDPELLTVKAVRVLQAAPVVAYFAKAGRRGNARRIVDPWLTPANEEMPLAYPVTTEIPFADPAYREALAAFYERSAERIAAHLREGRDVALLSEGDPLFYGSFMHLYLRLKPRFATSIVPGVAGICGAWGAAGMPMAWGDDVLVVAPGTLPLADLVERLGRADSAAIMKIGRNLAKVREALRLCGMTARALYVERATMENEVILPFVEKCDDLAPYFSMVLVPGGGRRP
jgi:precorrin-2/cobalt-factor-2 C20-methyltransferase